MTKEESARRRSVSYKLLKSEIEENRTTIIEVKENQKRNYDLLTKISNEMFPDEQLGKDGVFKEHRKNTTFRKRGEKLLALLLAIGSILLTAFSFNYFGDKEGAPQEKIRKK